MTSVYRWDGRFFGFLAENDHLFDEQGRLVAWISDGRHAWNALNGAYLGDRAGPEYILRDQRPAPHSRPFPIEPTALCFLPDRPHDLTWRGPRAGFTDGLDGL
jgi:hypothetical protein